MICTCANCRSAYWRYRLDWSTPGFCTLFCRDMWMNERPNQRQADPGMPVAILALIRHHVKVAHAGDDWPVCEECERLEAWHAAAIAYHLPPTAEQMSPRLHCVNHREDATATDSTPARSNRRFA